MTTRPTVEGVSELLPCPFCGERADNFTHSGQGPTTYLVSCIYCSAEVSGGPDKQKAIEAWNRRDPAPTVVPDVKRYRFDAKHGLVEDNGSHDYWPVSTSGPMVAASDYDALRQQLADERKEIVKLEHWLLRKDEQLAEMRAKVSAYLRAEKAFADNGIYRDERYWALNDIRKLAREELDAALAPTSQPSRGKCPNCSGPASPDTHNLHVCSTCNGKGYIGQPLVDLADCPDCAQPERQAVQHKSGCGYGDDGEYKWRCTCGAAQPERQDDEDGADTGNAEADRVLRRLASSDPDFDDCTAAAVLIRRLVADMRGPDGFATWKDAAIAERVKRPSPPPTDVAPSMDKPDTAAAKAGSLSVGPQDDIVAGLSHWLCHDETCKSENNDKHVGAYPCDCGLDRAIAALVEKGAK